MSVSAQLAQNSKLHIAGTSGAAKTITAISLGFPAIVTSTAHGLANGDYVAVAAIVGTVGTDATNGLNGKSFVVKNVTANTFAIEANTTGLVYTSGGTATPSTWIEIKEIKAIKPSGASATKIDVTDLSSTAKEYRAGLVDHGTLSADVFVLESDPGQAAALAQFQGSTVVQMKFVTPGKTRTFSSTCLKFPTAPDSSVDGVQTGSAEWQINGTITVS
jgi:hypothetical protein